MKKIIVILFLFFLPCLIRAQVPGYLGQKFSVYYSGIISPRFSNPAYDKNFYRNTTWNAGINYRHDLSADYVVSRSVCLGIGFKFFRTGEDGALAYSFSGDNVNYSFTTNDVNIISKTFTVYIKKFLHAKKGYLAPVGSYYKLEAGVIVANTHGDSITSTLTNNNNNNNNNEPISSFKFPYTDLHAAPIITPVIILTAGQQFIYHDRYFFNWGCQFGFTPGALGQSNDPPGGYGGVYNGMLINSVISGIFNTRAVGRMQTHMLFNVEVGTGILLF